MLLTIVISVICVEIQDRFLSKNSGQILLSYWNQWNLRVMVLASLLLQLLLIWFGHKRRRYAGNHPLRLAMLVWSTYMLTELMATAVLSTLLRRNLDIQPHGGLVAFWTPFLLWHLGGSYNITAYSLADNELWLRHFFAMVFQVGEAIYIFIIYGNGVKDRTLKFIACPIFIAGFLKYGERIWALRCASEKELVKSVYSAPDLVQSKSSSDDKKTGGQMIRTGLYDYDNNNYSECIGTNRETNILKKASLAFEVFRPLFFCLPFELSKKFHDAKVYLDESEEEAFKMVEIELEFLYDLLFTKLPVQFCKQHGVSLALRIFCFGCAVSSLIAFSLIPKHPIPKVDMVITYLMLGQVILLDLYTYYLQCRSIWLVREFPGYKLYSLPLSLRLCRIQPAQGIKVMARHSLIHHYVKQERSRFWSRIIEIFDTNDLIWKFLYTKWSSVNHDLKKFIFSHLKQKREKCTSNGDFDFKLVPGLLEKEQGVLLDKCGDSDDSWDIKATDFTSRIFVWHIATELVYYGELDQCSSRKIGKYLSDYMMYLVLVRPLMLPKGLNETINRRTHKKARNFFPPKRASENSAKKKGKKRVSEEKFAEALLTYSGEEGPFSIHSTTSSSIENILFEGRRIAKRLQTLAREERWEMIGEVWMEKMIYAAVHCSWREHAQELRHGGELLTHVALLMAHLGLSTQIQEQKDRGEEDDGSPYDNPLPFPV